MRRLFPVAIFVAVLILTLPLSAQEKDDKGTAKDTEMTGIEGNEKESPIELVRTEPFFYCAVEMTGSYTQHPDAFMKLYTEAAKQNIAMAEAPFGIYFNSPNDTAEEALKWEIGLAVPEGKEILAPLSKKKWEHTFHVTKGFEGSIETESMSAVYAEMFEWMAENGYEPAGPIMEKYLSTPSPNEEGEFSGKLQIAIPVQKAKR